MTQTREREPEKNNVLLGLTDPKDEGAMFFFEMSLTNSSQYSVISYKTPNRQQHPCEKHKASSPAIRSCPTK